MRPCVLALATMLALSACQDDPDTAPGPRAMTADAVGHYCQMDVLSHEGPKAQIHLAGMPEPIWFSQVRDAVAFTRLPEETARVTAFYVSDMGRAASWARPGAENWTAANAASYVIGSVRGGGMGAPEAVPFADRIDAEAFVALHGGEVMLLDEIPDAYVLGPVELAVGMEAKP